MVAFWALPPSLSKVKLLIYSTSEGKTLKEKNYIGDNSLLEILVMKKDRISDSFFLLSWKKVRFGKMKLSGIDLVAKICLRKVC